MTRGRRAIVLAASLLAGWAATGPAMAQDRGALRESARRLATVQREGDADGLRALLAPAARDALPPAAAEAWLAACRTRLGRLVRVSLPTMANRRDGFFVAYLPDGPTDMFLSLDAAGRVSFWSVGEGERGCALGAPS